MIDHYLITHFGMTHPDIWLMWLAVVLSVYNFMRR
jgi:hypothetical protein